MKWRSSDDVDRQGDGENLLDAQQHHAPEHFLEVRRSFPTFDYSKGVQEAIGQADRV